MIRDPLRSCCAAILLFLGASPTLAICAALPDRLYEPGRWDAVFLGRVQTIVIAEDIDLPEYLGPSPAQEVRFEVLAGWRGVAAGVQQIAVLSPYSEAAPRYREGHVFVVWALRYGLAETEDPLISAVCISSDFCSEPTRELLPIVRRLGQPKWFLGAPPAQRCGWHALHRS
ncbi:MAG: hypothetical protein AAGK22_02635 [Acidobacteriota bacterium]